jgi:integrase
MRQSVSVEKANHPRYSHRVRFPGADGATVQKWFKSETAAKKFAKERSKEIGREGLAFGVIGEDEKAAVQYWRSFLSEVADTPPPPLLAILQDYAATWKANRSSVTVAAAVDAYECAKTSEGLRPLSLQALRTRCSRFVKDFGSRPISSITTAEISDWILSLEATRAHATGKATPKAAKTKHAPQVGLVAKRNHRLALSGLFAYAKTRGWVKENPVTDAARPKPPKTRPGILRPSDVSRFFAALQEHAPALVPFWAVRFFAGIREQEALRMDWSMVDLMAGEIHLPDTVTKTGHPRTVKMEANLAAFLTPHARPDGAIAPKAAMKRRYHLAKAHRALQAEDAEREAAGDEVRPFPVPMPANAARHSFATFHLLAFRHAGETALQLGHGGSPEMLHRHYKGMATEAEALAFWSIHPAEAPGNVVAMQAADPTAEMPKTNDKKKAAR